LDGLPDLSTESERDGFYQAQLIRELTARHITDWTGVELEGGPAPPTPQNIGAVMELYPVGEADVTQIRVGIRWKGLSIRLRICQAW
jgi:hypothetical protein